MFAIVTFLILISFTPQMYHNYYTYSHFMMLILFGIKVAVDWLSDSMMISLSGTLVILFTTFNTMNFKVVPIIIYCLIYLI